MEYNLLPAQKEFLEIPHKHKIDVALYQGGYGSGKTWSGSLLGLILCIKHPGIRGLVGAKTYRLIRDTTYVCYKEHLEAFGYKLGKDYSELKSEGKLIFNNGSEILFRHLDEPESIKSLNLGFVEIEEMSDTAESSFHMLLSRLRQANIKRFRLFGHTNPEQSKGWIYKHFVEKPKENYRLILAPTTQNTFLAPEYVENMKQIFDAEYYRINVLGEFGDYTKGLVVKGFTDENIKDIKYYPDETLYITCDFNVDPMMWAIAHKSEDRVYFFDEIVIENTNTEQTINAFIDKYKTHYGDIVICGDASGDYRKTSSNYSDYAIIQNKLREHGFKVKVDIRSFNPPIKHRVNAFNAKVLNGKGERNLFVSKNCEHILNNINNLKYKDGTSDIDTPTHNQVRKDKNTKFLGHIFDAVSYLVEFYYPVLENISNKKEVKKESVLDNFQNQRM